MYAKLQVLSLLCMEDYIRPIFLTSNIVTFYLSSLKHSCIQGQFQVRHAGGFGWRLREITVECSIYGKSAPPWSNPGCSCHGALWKTVLAAPVSGVRVEGPLFWMVSSFAYCSQFKLLRLVTQRTVTCVPFFYSYLYPVASLSNAMCMSIKK